ncbi:MAG: ATP-binding cassette domain-containing protein [Desulfobacteraceae bacterium]|jgi:ABC-2 type transport system ATP-binding protein
MKATRAIETRGLTRRFADLTAVDTLDLSVTAGQIYGLVGPDGAGKTTTLRMLAAILDPSDGQAWIAGCDIRKEPDRIRDRIAYMSQRFGLYPDLTVQENIHFYADLYGLPRKDRRQRMDELLGFSGMLPFKKRRAEHLSGGMKQKLQLVCALIHTPKVLLLDEPTNGVDPLSRRDFWRVLYRLLKEGVAILVTTAYLDEAERCHRVGLLHQGRLLDEGPPEQVKNRLDRRILNVRTPRPRAIAKALDPLMGKGNVFGDSVHWAVAKGEDVVQQARQALNARDLPSDAIDLIDPTLEDVFVQMITARAADTAQAEDVLSHAFQKESRPAGNGPVVTVRDMTRRFGAFTAVNNISFDVGAGEIFGFLGPNGAGKSTTIRMLCGLLAPTSGGGSVAGFDVAGQPEKIKHHIGYMSQKFSLYDDLTVEENIAFYGGIYGLANQQLQRRMDWALSMAGLSRHRRSLTKILSGGWKQRLALACAVLHEPPVVFLDEPTSGVDPISRRRFWDLIHAMAEHGITIFVTTHYMEEAEYCGRLALIYRGRLIALGTPAALKAGLKDRLLIDVRCERPQEALEALQDLPEIKEGVLFGAGLHLDVHSREKAVPAIRERLGRSKIAFSQVGPIAPSMEDVFVSLIESEDRNGEPS